MKYKQWRIIKFKNCYEAKSRDKRLRFRPGTEIEEIKRILDKMEEMENDQR